MYEGEQVLCKGAHYNSNTHRFFLGEQLSGPVYSRSNFFFLIVFAIVSFDCGGRLSVITQQNGALSLRAS